MRARAGYILQPPCLWGSPDFGLSPPPSVDGFVLGAVKTSNATYGHHGEMAWQQPLSFVSMLSSSYLSYVMFSMISFGYFPDILWLILLIFLAG